MCFTYKLNKSAKAIEDRFIAEVVNKQGNLFFEQPQNIYNGFSHPRMPVISSKEPNLIQFLFLHQFAKFPIKKLFTT